MGQEDVLVEVLINGKDMLQFYSTKENYKTLFEDRDALIDTVKTAFKEGVLYSADINVDDIHTVEFLSDVAEVAEVVEDQHVEQEVEEEETYHTYEIVEEPMENLTSSSIPEELIMDVGFSGADERLNLCPHCDYRTFNVGHFKIHMRQHTGEAPFQCDLCDYKSKQNSNLKRHMKQHLLGKDHFDCKLCNFSCTQEKVYKRHMILHSRTRPLRPCPFCDYFSTSLAHLTVHIRQHTGETPYHCGLCSYKTVQKSNLTRHLKKHRRGKTSKADKLRCCSHCSYRTPNPAHLLAHIRAAHTGETPYACNLCNYKSAQRSNLKRHLRKHSGERPYNCDLCNYSTAYPYVLKKHLENHPVVQMTRMTCDMCDYMTFSAIHFKKHLKTHAGSALHSCSICGFIALNNENLKMHLKKHSSTKPFKCKYCHFRTASKINLRRHQINKHSGTQRTEAKAAVSEEKNDHDTVEEVISEEHAERDDEEMRMHGVEEETEIIEEHEGEIIENGEHIYVEQTSYIEDMHEEEAVEVHITEVEEDKSQLDLIEHDQEHGTEETVEVVVNEEDVVTTPMEEQQYTIIEEYDDGKGLRKLYRCVLCSYHTHDSEKLELHIRQHNREQIFRCKFCDFRAHSKANVRQHMRKQHIGNTKGIHSSDTESSKTKNISFLNKNQTEKLKEFKRLLQEGTKLVAQNVTHTRIQPEESLKRNSNTELDNISERTESVTEEINLEEDLNDTAISQVEDSSNKNHIDPADEATHIVYDNGETVSLNQLAEDSSVLIVGGVDGDQEYEVIGRYQVETAEEEKIPDAALVISCELCGHETRTVSELKAHIGTHTGETALPKSKSAKQSPTSYFKCDKCSFRTFRELDLSRHKALFHGESLPQRLPFVCGSCGYRSASKSEFQKHVETSHQASVKCKICELKVSSQEELKHHSRNHIGEEPFECYYCAYLTARKCHLKKHMKRRHNLAKDGGKGPPYECYTCGYETSLRNDFHNHITEHKAEVNNTYRCQVDSCRFLTLDKDVYKKHMMVHSVTTKRDPQDTTANFSKESHTNDFRLTSEASKTNKRVPLKEYGNLPESDRTKLINTASLIKPGASPLPSLNKKLVRDDDPNSPMKKKRKGLKSLNPEESLIDNRLARKFNFDTKNLATSPKRFDHGLGIDFVGEVYKGHGSLRKFVNYGDVITKSDFEEAIVLTHPENEAQLRVIYNHFKELLSSIKKRGPDEMSSHFTIYFKEMEPREGQDEEDISNVDIDISSSDEEEKISSTKDEESDIEMYDEPSDDEPQLKQVPIIPEKPSNSRNGYKKAAPELVFDLDGEDKVQFIQEKIRQRNEKRKELRKLKAMNISLEKKTHFLYDE